MLLSIAMLSAAAQAQNPVPHLSTVTPTAVAPGTGPFTLTVYGANFVPDAVVNWNYRPRSTTFVSAREVQAQILATDIANPTAGYITVTNPAPGGGSSSASWAQVEVHAPTSTIVPTTPWVMQIPYSFGYGPLLLADINGDHKLDLWSSGIQMLGNKNATFHFGSLTTNYHDPSGVVYGDFNGDGNIDIAFVSGDSSLVPAQQILVMLGDGKGRFTFASKITNWAGFGAMATGDFNGDGKLDLAVTEGRNLTVFLGNGDGAFQQGASYAMGKYSYGVVVGDFDGDGKLDLLATTSNGTITFYFDLYAGNGDGTFQFPPKQVSSITGGICLVVSDFNADGILDLATCNQSQIGIQLGNGNGTFQPPTFYTVATSGNSFDFAAGDFTSNGRVDLIVSQYPAVTQFSFLVGNGDGTLQPPQVVSLSGGYNAEGGGMTVGDFNNDGLLDFLLVDGRYIGIVYAQQ
jgi:hypothetical protein